MTNLPESKWSQENPRGTILRRYRSRPIELPAYRRMREAAELRTRLKREAQEVKEGKKKETSKH